MSYKLGSRRTTYCPYCGAFYSYEGKESKNQHVFEIENYFGSHIIVASYIYVCANPECLRPLVAISVGTTQKTNRYINDVPVYEPLEFATSKTIKNVIVLPDPGGKVFPEVPAHVWNDYDEACKIRDLSPRASATLARRCLQSMIRDFWGISGKYTLNDEIKEVANNPTVPDEIRDALYSIKNLGNIGAHPERDINTIVDIESSEVNLIIEVIEMLFDEWYAARAQRQKRLNEIKKLAQSKKT